MLRYVLGNCTNGVSSPMGAEIFVNITASNSVPQHTENLGRPLWKRLLLGPKHSRGCSAEN